MTSVNDSKWKNIMYKKLDQDKNDNSWLEKPLSDPIIENNTVLNIIM